MLLSRGDPQIRAGKIGTHSPGVLLGPGLPGVLRRHLHRVCLCLAFLSPLPSRSPAHWVPAPSLSWPVYLTFYLPSGSALSPKYCDKGRVPHHCCSR